MPRQIITVLDPTTEPISAAAVAADRPATLDGLVLGLLANGKVNSKEILAMVADVLSDRYEFKDIVEFTKGSAYRPCPEDLLTELSCKCDIVITASGD